MLDIYSLYVFLIAAETENFSEAGRRLHLSQPAISMQIRSLESQLGTPLFERSGRHITLSEAGHTLVPMARELVSQSIHIEETMASLQGEVMGLLKIGCSTTVGKYVLPKLLVRLRERHPQVQASCAVTSRGSALNMLVEGDVHLALTSLREPLKDIEYRLFLRDRLILVTSPDHIWAQGDCVIYPEQLPDGEFITREETAGTTVALRDALVQRDLSLDDLNVVTTLGNSEAIAMAVQEGLGVAFVSALVATNALMAGTLAEVAVRGLSMEQQVHMARHTGRPATAAQTAFWEMAFSREAESIRKLPATNRINAPLPA